MSVCNTYILFFFECSIWLQKFDFVDSFTPENKLIAPKMLILCIYIWNLVPAV